MRRVEGGEIVGVSNCNVAAVKELVYEVVAKMIAEWEIHAGDGGPFDLDHFRVKGG